MLQVIKNWKVGRPGNEAMPLVKNSLENGGKEPGHLFFRSCTNTWTIIFVFWGACTLCNRYSNVMLSNKSHSSSQLSRPFPFFVEVDLVCKTMENDTAIPQCFLPNYELIFLCFSLLFSVLCLDPIHTGRTLVKPGDYI